MHKKSAGFQKLRPTDKNRATRASRQNGKKQEKEVIKEQYITKRTHDTSHNHPDLVGTLDKCKFVLDNDAIEKDAYDFIKKLALLSLSLIYFLL